MALSHNCINSVFILSVLQRKSLRIEALNPDREDPSITFTAPTLDLNTVYLSMFFFSKTVIGYFTLL